MQAPTPFGGVPLSHEGHAVAHLLGHLPDGQAGQGGVVDGSEGLVGFQVQLELPGAALVHPGLPVQAQLVEAAGERIHEPHDQEGLGCGVHAPHVAPERSEVAVTAAACLGDALLEGVELDLEPDPHREAPVGELGQEPLGHSPRALRNGAAVGQHERADDRCHAVSAGVDHEGRHVGCQVELGQLATPRRPGGHEGVVVDVETEDDVGDVGAGWQHLEQVGGRDVLSDEATVGEAGHEPHCAHGAACGQVGELAHGSTSPRPSARPASVMATARASGPLPWMRPFRSSSSATAVPTKTLASRSAGPCTS